MFYDKFIALCERDGVSPSKVMTDSGFNKATVSMWKRKYLQGVDVRPSFDMLSALSKYFNVSSDYLLGTEQQSECQKISDEELKFALFDGAADKITPEMFAEVKQFAQFIAERVKDKDEQS